MAHTRRGQKLTQEYKENVEQRSALVEAMARQLFNKYFFTFPSLEDVIRLVTQLLAPVILSEQRELLDDSMRYSRALRRAEAPGLSVEKIKKIRALSEVINRGKVKTTASFMSELEDIIKDLETYQRTGNDLYKHVKGSSSLEDIAYAMNEVINEFGDDWNPEDEIIGSISESTLEDIQEELQNKLLHTAAVLQNQGYDGAKFEQGLTNSAAGLASKLVQEPAREAIETSVRRGYGIVGYSRVTDSNPCAFCALLASKGEVYTTVNGESAVRGLFKVDSFKRSAKKFSAGKGGTAPVHDHCTCCLEPVYRSKDGKIRFSKQHDYYARVWAEVAAGRSDGVKAFTRYMESRTLPYDYNGDLPGKRRRQKSDPDFNLDTPLEERKGKKDVYKHMNNFLSKSRKRLRSLDHELGNLYLMGHNDTSPAVKHTKLAMELEQRNVEQYQKDIRWLIDNDEQAHEDYIQDQKKQKELQENIREKNVKARAKKKNKEK